MSNKETHAHEHHHHDDDDPTPTPTQTESPAATLGFRDQAAIAVFQALMTHYGVSEQYRPMLARWAYVAADELSAARVLKTPRW